MSGVSRYLHVHMLLKGNETPISTVLSNRHSLLPTKLSTAMKAKFLCFAKAGRN